MQWRCQSKNIYYSEIPVSYWHSTGMLIIIHSHKEMSYVCTEIYKFTQALNSQRHNNSRQTKGREQGNEAIERKLELS